MTQKEEKLTMRPLNLKEDYDQLIPFYDMIFEKELESKGSSVQAMMSEMKAFMPIFKFMGIFSKNYRHVFDGFVFENNQKEIVSTVNVAFSGNYWEIAMVATHPKYRRKGLAKQLIQRSLEHAKKHKAEMCVLEVLEENTPAYQLYINYGFHHFDTKMKMKLPYEKMISIDNHDFPKEYSIQKRKMDKKTSQEMYELEARTTPTSVLEFLPVNRIKYHKPLSMRIIRPFVKLFVDIQAERWNIFHNEKLIGILYLDFGKSDKDCHSIEVLVDPTHNKQVTKHLIRYAINQIKNKSSLNINTITIVRKSDEYLVDNLLESGFEIFETNHILGLKFK
jgi:ribosomal protein S18 acetylase RimI-like enzyme